MTQTTTTTTSNATGPTNIPNELLPQPEVSPLSANVGHSTNRKLNFDPEALAQKYAEERNKRLQYKPLGSDEYQSINGEFSSLLNDPYCTEKIEREPIQESCDALVIGGGYGAQLVAVRLLEQGVSNIKIIEKGGDFGGTWYWNRYPGAQCDIESYVYMPLLDETGYVPSMKYASGAELLRHSQAIGAKYGLYDRAIFQTEVQSMTWREEDARWDVRTNRNDTFSARFVIPAAGPLHRPKLPGLRGLGDFKGHSFHPSRWDYEYTGGDITGKLTKLADKRVGVIGTGATAVQIVPHLGEWAKELYVFQRTPSSIDVRGNKPTDPAWVESLDAHWQKKRMDNFNIIVNGGQQDEDLVADGWTDILRKLTRRGQRSAMSPADAAQMAEQRQLLDFEKMEQIRRRVDSVVQDRKTAESLKPYYNQFCKRPCFHDEYLPTFNRPNVTLVDTQGRGVEAVTARGVVANGTEYPLDCLIYATGFEHATAWSQKTGLEVFGRGGVSLTERWRDGPSTLHGLSARAFPNCFFVTNAQAGLSPNFLHVTAAQAAHIAYLVAAARARGLRSLEPTAAAEAAWVAAIVASGARRRAFQADCTPGYYNNEGQTTARSAKAASHGGGALEYMRIINEWRAKDDLEGMEVTYGPEAR